MLGATCWFWVLGAGFSVLVPGSLEMRSLEVRHLGLMPYDEALVLQRQLVEQRRADQVGDLLLLVEHPAVLTLGVKGDGGRAHILATAEALAGQGISVFETGRGGDVTYHGPGQIVGYPILNLKPDRCDVHRYVRDLEEVLLGTRSGKPRSCPYSGASLPMNRHG